MSDIDLNLLAIFDALYELRSVTRTAQRLNLTQSAVSHALRRLRDAIGDPLFVRASGGLRPTARAVEIAPGVREGLGQLRGALAPTEFDPATSTRNFAIAAGSYFCALLVPKLVARARREAPRVSLSIVPVGASLLADIDEGLVDLALGAFARVPKRLASQALFREDLVWISAASNPIAASPIDPDVFLAQPRLGTMPLRPFDASKALLSQGGLESRRVADIVAEADPAAAREDAAAVYDTMTAATIVARTDLIALVPRRIARLAMVSEPIVVLDIAGPNEGIDLAMVWHGKQQRDAGLVWLRELLVAMTTH